MKKNVMLTLLGMCILNLLSGCGCGWGCRNGEVVEERVVRDRGPVYEEPVGEVVEGPVTRTGRRPVRADRMVREDRRDRREDRRAEREVAMNDARR